MTAWLSYQLVSRNLSTVQIFLNRLPGRYSRPEGDTVSLWHNKGAEQKKLPNKGGLTDMRSPDIHQN